MSCNTTVLRTSSCLLLLHHITSRFFTLVDLPVTIDHSKPTSFPAPRDLVLVYGLSSLTSIQTPTPRTSKVGMYGTRLPYVPTEAEVEEFHIPTKLDPEHRTVGDPCTPSEVARLLDDARQERYVENSGYEPYDLLRVIDPQTGDSVLQLYCQHAVAGVSLQMVKEVMSKFDRRIPKMFFTWARHAYFSHQNDQGYTVFHTVARRGYHTLLTMMYRCIQGHWSWVYPEEQDMGEGKTAPECKIYPATIEYEESATNLMFLVTQNSKGRTPAAEAHHAGHHEVAQWLEAVASRLDRDSERRSEAGVADMLVFLKDHLYYNEMRDWQVFEQTRGLTLSE